MNAAARPTDTGPSRPNLLFVFSDEHRACSLPGEPYCDVQAPQLERLAREGTSFRNCISNYPLCSPYRAMLLSGRWPFQTGVIDNVVAADTSLGLRDDEFSLGEVFRRAGYHTGYIGKWHLLPTREFIPTGPARHGFEDWQVWTRTALHFGAITFDPDTGQKIRCNGYSATLMTDAALEFIGRSRDKPWMLVMSWGPPHPPFETAPPETMRLYDPNALQLRPNVPLPAAPGLRTSLQGYYAHISALDAELGRLLSKLDETRQAAHTIVVYTSDHGTMLGSHGWTGKRCPFDEASRVPLVLRYPGVIPPNRKAQALLGAIDLFPSLCGVAGVPVPEHCEGADLSATMRGTTGPRRESAFLMHVQRKNTKLEGGGRHAPLFRGVRTERFTYAIAEDGRWCLYDDSKDPYQLRNLIDDPEYAGTAANLDDLVADWLNRAKDTFPLSATRGRYSTHAPKVAPRP